MKSTTLPIGSVDFFIELVERVSRVMDKEESE